jgi:tRNA (cmo5U34)-methyltransferase
MAGTGDSIYAENAGWTFGGDVPEHFEDHVSKSVPLYEEGHDLVLKIADFFVDDRSICYELGCSTAALTRKLAERNARRRTRFIGVDIQESMTQKAAELSAGLPNVSIVTADVLDFDFEPADLIIAYYTVQFVRPRHRQQLIDRVYESLNWGGAFLLFEKVRGPDARFQDLFTALYTDYKLDRGYGPDEIVGKARSLKGVLEPFSSQGNLDLLRRAGFVDITTVMKYVCFEGFLAIK